MRANVTATTGAIATVHQPGVIIGTSREDGHWVDVENGVLERISAAGGNVLIDDRGSVVTGELAHDGRWLAIRLDHPLEHGSRTVRVRLRGVRQ